MESLAGAIALGHHLDQLLPAIIHANTERLDAKSACDHFSLDLCVTCVLFRFPIKIRRILTS